MKDKILLITGGTGSFGNAVLKSFVLKQDFSEIRVFSRDEKKQDDMRRKIASSKVKYYLGDVRDYESILNAMVGVDYVFHASALKQVPSCEFYPMEAVKTNIVGTENVLNAAVRMGVEKVVCLSTDKAAYPVNAMGISKAMMEKIAVAKSRMINKTIITITRYGNVMASRGSVIPLFIEQMKNGLPITITDPNMTRFMMTLDQAVDLVLYAFENGRNGELFVQKAPAARIGQLAEALREIFQSQSSVRTIGTRHGEKVYETLLTREEKAKAVDLGDYYRVTPDDRGLNYDKYFSIGKTNNESVFDYHSHNTYQLTDEELKELILSLDYVKNELANI